MTTTADKKPSSPKKTNNSNTAGTSKTPKPQKLQKKTITKTSKQRTATIETKHNANKMILSERAVYIIIAVTLLFATAIIAYSYVLNSMLDVLEVQLRLQPVVTQVDKKNDDAYLFFTNYFPLNASDPATTKFGQSLKPENDKLVNSITLQIDSANIGKLDVMIHRFVDNSQKDLIGEGSIVLNGISKPTKVDIEFLSPVELRSGDDYLISLETSSTTTINIAFSEANTISGGVMYTYKPKTSEEVVETDLVASWERYEERDLMYELH
ncbi:hypothetical protein H6762_03540 [Candidatus Nomurabacteria bacterium]|uniref:Uncharacterized protein n=1 Tax=Candidatus Dojkabacteria bacterium TaxID=2099670 RepID=A0A955KWV9_9BACT|nr:hypothetical protein [Candidatus Dojkabacteria bacterium]MCB9790033.1 hypothetical protein [Candidatus Nomurabacteria bacterium]